MNTIVTEI